MIQIDASIIDLISAVAQVLFALAFVIAAILGNLKINGLKDLVNGKFSELLAAAKTTSKTEGKVEIIERIIQDSTPTATLVTKDKEKE